MKNLFEYGFVIGLGLLFCACHDNDGEMDLPVTPEEPGEVVDMPEIDGKVYSAGDNFVLTSGYMTHGGVLEYNIKLKKGQHASISFDGKENGAIKFYTDNLDLSTIEGNPVSGEVARPALGGFGKEVSVPLKVVPYYDTRKYYLSGEQVVSGVKVTVSHGFVTSEGFKAQFDENYVMGEDHSSGFKNEGASYMIGFPEHDASYHYTVSPFIVGIDSSVYPKESEENISLSDVMQVLLNTPFLKESDYGFDREIDRDISISTLWGRLIPGFGIPDDCRIYPLCFGIYAIYPPETFCASDVTESSYRLHFDPAKVFEMKIAKSKNGTEKYALNTPALYSLLSNIFLALTPGNAEGILMEDVTVYDKYRFETIFSDRAIGMKVLSIILSSAFSDPNAIERMKNALENEGMNADILASVVYVANNLDSILNNTDGATFGWSYCSVSPYFDTSEYYYEKLYEN
ncbi:MAG: hypothetical protein K2I16_06315 [Muribaculaceae bacterium]|nr:hypothetical protein [Muribaculaceae bacterium]